MDRIKKINGITSFCWAWLRALRLGPKSDQLHELEALVSNYLSLNNNEDCWDCTYRANRSFEVKDMRKLIEKHILYSTENKVMELFSSEKSQYKLMENCK